MIVNLLPHKVVAIAEDGQLVEWPPHPKPADLNTKSNGVWVHYRVSGDPTPNIPIYGVQICRNTAVRLPEETAGNYYIVPIAIALMERFRIDLLVPWMQDGLPSLTTVSHL